MHRLSWRYHLYGQVILMVFILSCKATRELSSELMIKKRPAKSLLDDCEQSSFAPEWCGMKINAEFVLGDEGQSFKATLRIRKDSVIWISVAPLLGIEMIRLMVTPDSLKYLSKIPDQKFYYLGGISELSEKTGADLSFDVLQNILFGNLFGLEEDERKFRSEVDSTNYLLISKYKRKVRKVVGMDDRKLESDTINVDFDNPRVTKKLRKLNDDGVVISRYWIHGEKLRVVKSVFDDIVHRRNFQIEYSNHELVDEKWSPKQCNMLLSNDGKLIQVRYDVDRISTGKPYEFPFEIGDEYPRRDTL